MAYELGLKEVAQKAGIPLWALITILFWIVFWKLFGMWKSARNGHVVWFIIIALVNTVGILPIIYIFGFSRMNFEQKEDNNSRAKSSGKKKSNKK